MKAVQKKNVSVVEMRVSGVPQGDGGDESSSGDSSLIRPKPRMSFAVRNSGTDNLNSSRRASLFVSASKPAQECFMMSCF